MRACIAVIGILSYALMFSATDANAQRRKTSKTARPATTKSADANNSKNDTLSVVLIPGSAAPKVDTSLIAPNTRYKRRRFGVKVVPAAPPGRSRQDILYSDSLVHRAVPPAP